jgi:hypothetical protein
MPIANDTEAMQRAFKAEGRQCGRDIPLFPWGGPVSALYCQKRRQKIPNAASIPYSIPWTLTLKPSVSSSRPQINSIAAFAAVARLSWAGGGDSQDGMAVPLGTQPQQLGILEVHVSPRVPSRLFPTSAAMSTDRGWIGAAPAAVAAWWATQVPTSPRERGSPPVPTPRPLAPLPCPSVHR